MARTEFTRAGRALSRENRQSDSLPITTSRVPRCCSSVTAAALGGDSSNRTRDRTRLRGRRRSAHFRRRSWARPRSTARDLACLTPSLRFDFCAFPPLLASRVMTDQLAGYLLAASATPRAPWRFAGTSKLRLTMAPGGRSFQQRAADGDPVGPVHAGVAGGQNVVGVASIVRPQLEDCDLRRVVDLTTRQLGYLAAAQ